MAGAERKVVQGKNIQLACNTGGGGGGIIIIIIMIIIIIYVHFYICTVY
jgi:hypothetical protein